MLESKNVFIDTQAFRSHMFQFEHPSLRRLLELSSSGQIQFIITETVFKEVKSQLAEQLSEAANTLGEFHKLIGAVESTLPEKYNGLRLKPSKEEFTKLALDAWDKYLVDSKAVIVPASRVNCSDLLASYFQSIPPFGKGKKKHEFPDAISVLSLADWMKVNQTNIYIISGDKDVKSWCEQTPNTFHLYSLGTFIDLYNQAEERLTELVRSLFQTEETRFLDAIKSQFLDSAFVFDDQWEAEVYSVEAHSISVDDVNVIEVKDTRTLISVMVEIEFSAEISGPNYDEGIWDSEDKKYVYLPEFNLNVLAQT